MRKTVKAKFESADTAEYAASTVNALGVNAKCELRQVPDASGVYNYSGVIPQSLSGTNILTNLFVPAFPENVTLSGQAVLEVSCPENSLGTVTETLLRHGGRIVQ